MASLKHASKMLDPAFLFFFLFFTTFQYKTLSKTMGNETDLEALLAFKSKIVHDPYGVLNSWNSSLNMCQWDGITCSRRHQRVTKLNLAFKDLAGSISPSIGNMSFLRNVTLVRNKLTGEIPPQIGRLFRMTELNLAANSLHGEIPTEISNCSRLMLLALVRNNLTGKIPHQLSALTNLQYIHIYFNNFSGEIPDSLGNLTALITFGANVNNLAGRIPDTFGQLKKLTHITLGGNNLSGTIPPSFYNLSSLDFISISYNQFTGTLPSEFGTVFPYLRMLQLSGNNFSGALPVSISNATNLVRMDNTLNHFTGKISIDFSNMKNLDGLSLSDNNLGSGEADEMDFIRSLANCSKFQILELANNQLEGEFPDEIRNFSTQLFYLSVSNNRLYGSMPSWIYDMVGVNQLLLFDNMLTGPISSKIGRLSKLERLGLGNNKLSGEIPPTLGNISVLSELSLQNNSFNGNIPSSIGNCKKLALFDLSQNNFSGTIPVEVLRISTLAVLLNLSHNSLHGEIPNEVGELINLSILDLSQNELSGEIPNTLGSCLKLESLFLNRNCFNGSIPSSFSSLRGIQDLDVSSNNLSGQIPSFLENFSLLNLNLSYNNFEGIVPSKGVFENTSAISIIGNQRLCGGISSLQLPKCASIGSNKQKNRRIRLLVIIITITFILSTIISSSLYIWFKKTRKASPSRAAMKDAFLNVSYENLLRATNGFSSENVIGVGSYGIVYKGILNNEENHDVVAIKVFDLSRRGASKSFLDECEATKNVRHRNILKTITSCSSVDFQGNEFKALVYEFMPNGSLEKWIHVNVDDQHRILSLQQRVNIAADVASALDYMHNSSGKIIVHCDLKPGNILLDGDLVAHLGDFGQARSLVDYQSNSNESNTIGIWGTIGYTAPEYGLGGEISTKGDVYSYGIFVLEMIIGKRPTDPVFNEGINLHNYAKTAVPDRVMEIIDPSLLNNITQVTNNNHLVEREVESVISMVKIGVACSAETIQDRIEIINVVRELHSIKKSMQNEETRTNRIRTAVI